MVWIDRRLDVTHSPVIGWPAALRSSTSRYLNDNDPTAGEHDQARSYGTSYSNFSRDDLSISTALC